MTYTRRDFLKFVYGTTIYFPLIRYIEYAGLWDVGDSILAGGFYPHDAPYLARSIIKRTAPGWVQCGTLATGHDCHNGWRTDELTASIPAWYDQLQNEASFEQFTEIKMVWIYAGANDVLQGSGYAMGSLVSAVRSVLPAARLVVSRIGRVGSLIDETKAFNEQQVDVLRGVDIIDYEDTFGASDYIVDMIHLNESGQAKLAQKFIEEIL